MNSVDIAYFILTSQILLLSIYNIWIYKVKNNTSNIKDELELINSLLEGQKHNSIVTMKDMIEVEEKARKIVVFSENIYRDLKNDGSFPNNIKGLGSFNDMVSNNLKNRKEYQYFVKNGTHSKHIYEVYLNTHKEVLAKENLPEFIFIPSDIFSFYSEIILYLIEDKEFFTLEGYSTINIRKKDLLFYLTDNDTIKKGESLFISSGNRWIAKIHRDNLKKNLKKKYNNTEVNIMQRFDCNYCVSTRKNDLVDLCFETHYFDDTSQSYVGILRGSNIDKLNNKVKLDYGRYSIKCNNIHPILAVNHLINNCNNIEQCKILSNEGSIHISSLGNFKYEAYEFLPAVSNEEKGELFYIKLEDTQVNNLVLTRNNLLKVHKLNSDKKIQKIKKEFIKENEEF